MLSIRKQLQVIWKLLTKPNEFNFHHGGFGLPHINDSKWVLIRFPVIPIYFEISFFKDYPTRNKIYPILLWPIFFVLFFYIAFFNLVFGMPK